METDSDCSELLGHVTAELLDVLWIFQYVIPEIFPEFFCWFRWSAASSCSDAALFYDAATLG